VDDNRFEKKLEDGSLVEADDASSDLTQISGITVAGKSELKFFLPENPFFSPFFFFTNDNLFMALKNQKIKINLKP
jgi:hypothetical protein